MKNVFNVKNLVAMSLILGVTAARADWAQDLKDKWQAAKDMFTNSASSLAEQLKAKKEELAGKYLTPEQKEKIMSEINSLKEKGQEALTQKVEELKQKYNSLTPEQRAELQKQIEALRVSAGSGISSWLGTQAPVAPAK